MKIWAVVPVKPLEQAKSRLADVLDGKQRSVLVMKMLQHTLDILAGWTELAGVMVVSADERVLQFARQVGVEVLAEPDTPGLNASLQRAAQEVCRRGGEAVLVVPVDLPCQQRSDLQLMLDHAAAPAVVVIAPDRHNQGTNCLLVAPPGVIPFCFGSGSLQKHLAAAAQAAVTVYVVESQSLGLDVDNRDDLDMATERSCF
jgi:2-phospho-L-lactate guanylyltransferase